MLKTKQCWQGTGVTYTRGAQQSTFLKTRFFGALNVLSCPPTYIRYLVHRVPASAVKLRLQDSFCCAGLIIFVFHHSCSPLWKERLCFPLNLKGISASGCLWRSGSGDFRKREGGVERKQGKSNKQISKHPKTQKERNKQTMKLAPSPIFAPFCSRLLHYLRENTWRELNCSRLSDSSDGAWVKVSERHSKIFMSLVLS